MITPTIAETVKFLLHGAPLAPSREPSGAPVLAFFVPGKPVSVNRLYGHASSGHRYVTPDARAWISSVWCGALQERYLTGWRPPQPVHNVRVACTFYGPTGDADNYLKCTLDGLKIGLGIDDRYFTPVSAERLRRGWAGVGCLIEVWDTFGEDGGT